MIYVLTVIILPVRKKRFSYNTSRSQLRSHKALHPLLTVVNVHRQVRQCQQSIHICNPNYSTEYLDNALQTPCASLLTVLRTITFLFTELSILFSYQYLALQGIYHLFWTAFSSILYAAYRIVTLYDMPFQAT